MATSAADVQKFLHDMDYPAKRDAIWDKARQNSAPNDVIDILKKLPDRQYNSAADVSKALGDIM